MKISSEDIFLGWMLFQTGVIPIPSPSHLTILFQPPLNSIKLEDIINYIDSEIIIIKIDIEGYECKALQPDVILNKQGKFIPYIFMEWRFLPTDKRNTCPHFGKWVQHFYDGGYLPFNPSEWNIRFRISICSSLNWRVKTDLKVCYSSQRLEVELEVRPSL